jgi:hypothetical protein
MIGFAGYMVSMGRLVLSIMRRTLTYLLLKQLDIFLT